MADPRGQQASEVRRISEKEKAQTDEKKLLMEMTSDMIAGKRIEVEDIMAAEHRFRYQKDFLRYHQELEDSLYGTNQGLDIAPR